MLYAYTQVKEPNVRHRGPFIGIAVAVTLLFTAIHFNAPKPPQGISAKPKPKPTSTAIVIVSRDEEEEGDAGSEEVDGGIAGQGGAGTGGKAGRGGTGGAGTGGTSGTGGAGTGGTSGTGGVTTATFWLIQKIAKK